MSVTVAELLATLEQRNVQLEVSGERLRFGPKHLVTPELRAALAEHKQALLALVVVDDAGLRWRAEAMRPRVPPTAPIPPMYARILPPPAPDDCCLSCGEPLTPGNRYNCEPCVRAAWQVLREVRVGDDRGPRPPERD